MSGWSGADTEPDEAPRRRQAVEHVHPGDGVGREQARRGVEPRRAGADDSDAQAAHRAEERLASSGIDHAARASNPDRPRITSAFIG